MARKEAAEIIMRNVYSYNEPQLRDQLESYILGETNTAPSGNDLRKKISIYQAYGFDQLGCFDENKNFIDNEDGEVLKRYTELLYKECPDKLSTQFQVFSGKYSLYKKLGFSKAFIKEDFQKMLLYATRYWWQTEKELVNKFIENYKDIADEYINEYDKVNGNAAFAAGMLLIAKLKKENESSPIEKIGNIFFGKKENIVEKLERFFYSILKKRLKDKTVKGILENDIKDVQIEKYYNKLDQIKFVFTSEMHEVILINKIIREVKMASNIIFQGVRIAAMAEPVSFLYIPNNEEQTMKNIEGLKLSDKYKLDFCLERISNDYRSNERYFYKVIEESMKSSPEYVKSIMKREIDEEDVMGGILLSLLIKNNYIDGAEKKEYLGKIEDILIKSCSEMYTNKEVYEYEFPDVGMEDFEFLRNEKAVLNGIKISENGNAYKHRVKANKINVSALSLIEYSTVARNAVGVVFKMKGYIRYLFHFIINYKSVCPVKNENIYARLYEKLGISFEDICQGYLDYRFREDEAEKKEFLEFAHKYEAEIYELLKNNSFEIEYLKSFINILYRENNGFDYVELTNVFEKKIKSITSMVEDMLKSKESEVRSKVEELAGAKSKITADTAMRLIRIWDNDKIEKDLKAMQNINEITEYIENLYTKTNDKNTPYAKEIDYANVRIKDSEEKISEKVMKYFVSEYIVLKDLYIIKGCKKIQEIVNIYDLRLLMKNIFDMWIAEGSTAKYRNLLLPLALTAGEAQIPMIKKQIDFWADNSKPGLATFAIQSLCMNGSKMALLTVDSMSRKHKNKRVKRAALEAMDIAAEAMGMSRDELDDIIVPDLGFGKDRTRIFSYGEREFKAILDDKMEITLFDNTGKQIKSLPKASAKNNDNEDMAAECKEELKNIKKQIKIVVESQKLRMAKAVIIGRKWSIDKWKELFIENPIMNSFATKLVWEEVDDKGNIIKTFRYMEDGTFNTVDEEEYELENGTYILPLHPADIDEEELAAWTEQLEDYEIIQPVDQLNIPVYTLKDDELEEKDITEFKTKKIYASTFKSAANKLGFNMEFAEYGECCGCTFIDESSNIKMFISTNNFYPGDYSTIISILKISFISRESNSEIVLRKVPKKLISLAYLAGNMITEKAIENREE
ncbi:DUF4132 domain-containing protein [Fusobacterium varium]|uniref:DUF4132 domain-containing protein n=1 Tax=Fusobacterium varium TaxID=856 RepID=UPI000E4279B6|nr:DUF4132 domain-containing protein [Fusobacterium varium]MCI6032974.1 DUF4132 domain-containing protein [Fusobacterium varium]RGJ30876.1 DUF4132 domain-containing protein [Fusobacterium varium]